MNQITSENSQLKLQLTAELQKEFSKNIKNFFIYITVIITLITVLGTTFFNIAIENKVTKNIMEINRRVVSSEESMRRIETDIKATEKRMKGVFKVYDDTNEKAGSLEAKIFDMEYNAESISNRISDLSSKISDLSVKNLEISQSLKKEIDAVNTTVKQLLASVEIKIPNQKELLNRVNNTKSNLDKSQSDIAISFENARKLKYRVIVRDWGDSNGFIKTLNDCGFIVDLMPKEKGKEYKTILIDRSMPLCFASLLIRESKKYRDDLIYVIDDRFPASDIPIENVNYIGFYLNKEELNMVESLSEDQFEILSKSRLSVSDYKKNISY